MKFITRDTDYALRTLVFMARGYRKNTKDVTTVNEIVEKLDLPKRFSHRILQRLAKNKILSSHKGKSGGFSFMNPPARIRLLDVVRIFQGDIELTNCLLKGKICPDINRCVLRKKIKEIGCLVNKEFKKITIGSLVKEGRI